MVKIKRALIPPASLSVESQKSYGSYSERDVVRQLKEDSYDKCYLCELKYLSDPEVEHLKPHYNRKRKELVFDWNNLSYSCRHCNLIKSAPKYDDKILDCCAVDPEEVMDHIFLNGHVEIHSKSQDEMIQMTADLIQTCFELRNTGIREAACQYRIKELAETMSILFKTLKKYKDNPEAQRYKRSLNEMLSCSSQFAAFKRNYVKKHLGDYPGLESTVI